MDRFLNNEPVYARPLGKLQHAWRWCQRKPLAAGLIGALSLLLCVLMIGVWFRWQYAATAERLAHTESLKKLSDYYAGISRARELLSSRQPGALWQAESEITQIAAIVPDEREQNQYDSLKADIDSRYDLRLLNSAMTRLRYGALAFSPDGQLLAVGQRKHSTGFTVNVFKTAALLAKVETESEDAKPLVPQTAFVVSTIGNAVSKLWSGDDRYQDGARSLAWSPDGNWLVVGSRFGQLTRWNMSDPKAAGVTWSCGDRPVASLFFSADGAQLLSKSNKLRQWDCARDWSEIHPDAEPVDNVVRLPASNMLLTHLQGLDAIGLVDGNTRELVHTWPDTVTMRPMATSPDGRLVAGLGDDGVAIRLAGTGELFQSIAATDEELEFNADSLAFLNGDLVAAKDHLRRLHIWEVGSGRPVIQPIASADDAMQWTFEPNNNWLVLTDVESRDLLKVYQLRSPTNVRSYVQHGQPRAVDFSADSRQLAIVGTGIAANNAAAWTELSQWSLRDGQAPQFIRAEHRAHARMRPPFGLAWHWDAQHIVWFVGAEGILISQTPRETAFPDRPSHNLQRHQFLPAGGAKSSAILIEPMPQKANAPAVEDLVRLRIGTEGEEKTNADKAMCVSWSPDGRNLWSLINDRKEIVVRGIDSLDVLGGWSNKHKEITSGLASFASLAVGPEFVVCGGENGTITVLPNKLPESNAGLLEPVHEFLGPGGCVNAIALGHELSHGSSAWMLIGTQTGKVQIRALPSGEVLSDVQSEHGSVQSVAIGSSGKLIVTGGDDGVMRLMYLDSKWRVTPWLTLPSHFNAIEQVRLSADEKYLAVVGRPAKHVLVWDLSLLKGTP